MTTDTFLLSLATALGAFAFLRIMKLEFEVSKLNKLVEYLLARGHE